MDLNINYGLDQQTVDAQAVVGSASNIVTGTNPAYTIIDFLNMYPQFAQSSPMIGNTTLGSPTVNGLANTLNLYIGGPISGTGIPNGSIITAIIDNSTITISNNATVTATGNTLTLIQLLLFSMVIQMYINLANACIMQARWNTSWQIAMGWFIAHFCTLYMQSMVTPNSPASAVLAAGQAKGLDTSQSVGDVSVSTDYNSIGEDLNGWAAWKLTVFGQQLATMGKFIGKGGIYVS